MGHASLVGSVLSVLLLFQASQQPPPRDQSAEGKKGTAVVRGRVVAADTGSPIRGAAVSLRSSEMKESRTALTDGDGRYELRELPAGRFTISASPSRYKPMYLSSSSVGTHRSRTLDLSEGQVLKDIDFALPRAGAISGRVLDEFGEPLANARLTLLASVAGRGSTQGGFSTTDDYGRYRLFGLEPGEYFVKAEVGMPTGFGAPAETREDYVPTFYPGTTNQSEAPPVKLEPSQELTDIDIRMARSRTFRITGLVLDSQGRPASSAMLSLSYQAAGSGFMVTSGMVKPDGSFEFAKLTPGDYVIIARAGPAMESGESSRPLKVTIAGADVENLTLTMSPGVTVAGHVVTDGGSVPAFKTVGLRVSGTPKDRALFSFGGQPSGALNDDWTFQLAGVRVPILLRITGRLPEGWRLRSVSYRDADITDVATDFAENTAPREVEIVISNHGARVDGVVLDDDGRPAPERVVLIFSTDPAARFFQSTRTRTASSDEQGRFKMAGLTPGSYLMVALDELPREVVTDSSALEPYVRLAARLTLGEDEQKTLNLRVAKLEK